MARSTLFGRKGAGASGSEGLGLYEKREKIYTQSVSGRFQDLRNFTLSVLILFYFLLPWFQWGGRQAIWFDLPRREFHLLGVTFWPQDLILLSWLLIIAAFSLFFFTVYAGRLWCGYACPQTVWTRYFMWIEQVVEGGRTQRIQLDRAAWTIRKFFKKALKHFLWIALAAFIAFTGVGLFTPIREIFQDLIAFSLSNTQVFWLIFVTSMSYLLSTALREQVCIHMCPYARFQGVMFDDNTLVISYDEKRGEPRGKRKRSKTPEEQGVGSCINCNLCVHVCPMGIDIRDGLQVACIGCAACIDACDDIMDKMDYEPGLIRYSTENELVGQPVQRIHPRLVAYGVMLTVMVGLFTYSLTSRVPVGLDIIRDRGRLYREIYDGGIENTYTLKILNMDQKPHRFSISAGGDVPVTYAGEGEVLVEPGELRSLPVHLLVSAEDVSKAERTSDVYFRVSSLDDPKIAAEHESRFIRPRSRE